MNHSKPIQLLTSSTQRQRLSDVCDLSSAIFYHATNYHCSTIISVSDWVHIHPISHSITGPSTSKPFLSYSDFTKSKFKKILMRVGGWGPMFDIWPMISKIYPYVEGLNWPSKLRLLSCNKVGRGFSTFVAILKNNY